MLHDKGRERSSSLLLDERSLRQGMAAQAGGAVVGTICPARTTPDLSARRRD
jgi:hypothetical protein